VAAEQHQGRQAQAHPVKVLLEELETRLHIMAAVLAAVLVP
jgi:hypothetical protein